jgi:hypothetical protein
MTWSDLPLKPTRKILRQFAAALAIVFLALALRRGFAQGHVALGLVFCAMSVWGVIGLIKPSLVRWLFIAATVVAFPIGWVVTHLVLAIMFYLILTPVSLFFRARKRDALSLARKPAGDTYWIERKPNADPARYFKQF